MGKIDALFIDSFHDSIDDAVKEAHRRKSAGEPSITSIEETAYGGWRVRSVPAEFAIEMMADSQTFGSSIGKRVYG